MSEGRPRRRVLVLVVGVIMMIAGAIVIGASQTAFAAKTVRLKSLASGNAFAMSDEQMMSTMPFPDIVVGDGARIRERITKRRSGTALGAALVVVGLIVAWFGLRRRRTAAVPVGAG